MMNSASKSRLYSQPREHEYYFELCALATSGTLTDPEWSELKPHLTECESCKELVQLYRDLARTGMSLLMPDAETEELPAQKSWSPELAKLELFARIARGATAGQYRLPSHLGPSSWLIGLCRSLVVPDWKTSLKYAAGVFMVAALTLAAYRVGRNRAQQVARVEIQASSDEVNSLPEQLKDLRQERTSLTQDLNTRAAEIDTLSQKVKRQTAEVRKWKTLESESEQNIQQQDAEIGVLKSEKTSLATERDAASQKLQEAEASLVDVEKRLDGLREQRASELLRTTTLEARINELSERFKESEETVKQQQGFLRSDRDIRELMGARELYIADVFDVDREGNPRRPFGRVFYTRGKSLIFYAFDLDRQPGVRSASIFQAWGRRGRADNRPLNMGIFYMDNQTNRRWMLRFDSPKLLAQIDAVFVTVEPRGGSQKPSGRPLLFASLRTPPNHP